MDNQSVFILQAPNRAINTLKYFGINQIDELDAFDKEKLKTLMGKKSYEQIIKAYTYYRKNNPRLFDSQKTLYAMIQNSYLGIDENVLFKKMKELNINQDSLNRLLETNLITNEKDKCFYRIRYSNVKNVLPSVIKSRYEQSADKILFIFEDTNKNGSFKNSYEKYKLTRQRLSQFYNKGFECFMIIPSYLRGVKRLSDDYKLSLLDIEQIFNLDLKPQFINYKSKNKNKKDLLDILKTDEIPTYYKQKIIKHKKC